MQYNNNSYDIAPVTALGSILSRLDSNSGEDGSDDVDRNSFRHASIGIQRSPHEMSNLFQPCSNDDKMFSYGYERSKILMQDNISPGDFFTSPDLLDGLEFLKSSMKIDPTLFVTNYAPLEPYTILPLHFRSRLNLDLVVNIINDLLSKDQSFSFQAFASESVWHISCKKDNMTCLMQINVYRGKSGSDFVIEGQRCDGEAYLANSIFYRIKSAIESTEFPDRENFSAGYDFSRLVATV